ncbi:MAG: DUF2089 domain-containing protein [Chloroflexi bacterium]|nr:DUF2089 domain-containing protein [Chloroflexota bacterium]
MQPLPNNCPLCGGEVTVTKIYCNDCDTSIEGRFTTGVFPRLNLEQLAFVETFMRCEGKITRVEAELGLSYPTIRNRLHDVIRAMGYEPGESEPAGLSERERRGILESLEKGEISYEDAMQMLAEKEA